MNCLSMRGGWTATCTRVCGFQDVENQRRSDLSGRIDLALETREPVCWEPAPSSETSLGRLSRKDGLDGRKSASHCDVVVLSCPKLEATL
jgi:hypothetical protein